MKNCQFKFKPNKIKYRSDIDTIDSSHKKLTKTILKKKDDLPNLIININTLKEQLNKLDNNVLNTHNYIDTRCNLIDKISLLEEEIFKIQNYDDEIDYYSKTHEILLNYYDMTDAINPEENYPIFNNVENKTTNINVSENDENIKNSDNNNDDNYENTENLENTIKSVNNETSIIEKNEELPIFSNDDGKLDLLNNESKLRRKEKKKSRKRIKNV